MLHDSSSPGSGVRSPGGTAGGWGRQATVQLLESARAVHAPGSGENSGRRVMDIYHFCLFLRGGAPFTLCGSASYMVQPSTSCRWTSTQAEPASFIGALIWMLNKTEARSCEEPYFPPAERALPGDGGRDWGNCSNGLDLMKLKPSGVT